MNRNDDFEAQLRRELRDGADELDAATRSRLNQARQQALAEFDRRGTRPAWLGSGWQPAIGMAAVGLLAVALWVGRGDERALPTEDVAAAADPALEFELLLADENLELIEDLDFYLWLDSSPASSDEPDLPG